MGNKLVFGLIYTLCAILLLSPGMGLAASDGRNPSPPAQSETDTEADMPAQTDSPADSASEEADPPADSVPPSEETSGEASGETSGESGAETEPPASAPYEDAITVFVSEVGETSLMDLEDYITRVVMAEMPRTFHIEAIKAQAVAARTYCVHRVLYGDGHGEAEAGICTDHTHCMAYMTEEEAINRWGEENAKTIYDTIRAAVDATAGEYLTWEGIPISALFHSSSEGQTEAAENVWGSHHPYLVPVSSPEEPRLSELTVSLSELNKILQKNGDSDFTDVLWNEANKITLTYNSSGRVATLTMNGYTMKGTAVRKALGLRSTDFSVEVDGGDVIFTVKGYGHGVGMSQYGADALAQSGADYREILLHYYTGVQIETGAFAVAS